MWYIHMCMCVEGGVQASEWVCTCGGQRRTFDVFPYEFLLYWLEMNQMGAFCKAGCTVSFWDLLVCASRSVCTAKASLQSEYSYHRSISLVHGRNILTLLQIYATLCKIYGQHTKFLGLHLKISWSFLVIPNVWKTTTEPSSPKTCLKVLI